MRIVRKLMSAALVCSVIFGVAVPSAVYANEITVTINALPLESTGQAPTIVDGHAFVPIRPVFEAIGFDVEWEADTDTAVMRRDGLTIRVSLGSYVFNACGSDYPLEVPAQNIGGSTMMPARAVLERAGYDLHWDGETRTLTIEATDFHALAEMGDIDAQVLIAARYAADEDHDRAAYWFRRAAEQENDAAQEALGLLYLEGIGVEYSPEQTVYWFERAAENNNPSAQNNLGVLHFAGYGVEQDHERAVYWYRRAVAQGYASAQNNLGFMYYMGHSVEQSYDRAVYWYRTAVEQDYMRAQNNLGLMHFMGLGVEQSNEQAVYWYRRAAEQGYAMAKNNLGVMYIQGLGVEQSNEQAAYWFRRSIETGNTLALMNLAGMPAQYRTAE